MWNRAKIEAAVANALAAREVACQDGSLDAYLWSFVGGVPRVNDHEVRCFRYPLLARS